MKHKMNGWKVAYMSTKKKEPREGAPMRKIDPNTATLDDCRVREWPILFSAPMVRAILENRKTQTRRVVKNAHIITCDDRTGATDTKCPYGVPGDRLWVKESHQHSTDARGNSVIVYAADDAAFFLLAEDNGEGDLCGVGGKADRSRCYPIDRWRPSIHMHRWASRITLEVVSIRVERVQEISVSDALAEGMIPTWNGESSPGVPCPNELQQFRDLWIKINGPASWESNIWAWVVEFKRIGGSIGT